MSPEIGEMCAFVDTGEASIRQCPLFLHSLSFSCLNPRFHGGCWCEARRGAKCHLRRPRAVRARRWRYGTTAWHDGGVDNEGCNALHERFLATLCDGKCRGDEETQEEESL